MAFCAGCGSQLGSGSTFCSSCGTAVTQVPTAQAGRAEHILFESPGVMVSNTRFRVNEQTYAINGVTSVQAVIETPSMKGPLILGAVGIVFVVGGLAGPQPVGAVVMAVIILVLAVFWSTRLKPTYTVVLHVASGEVKALSSKDSPYIRSIVDALNNAIIHRG